MSVSDKTKTVWILSQQQSPYLQDFLVFLDIFMDNANHVFEHRSGISVINKNVPD